MLRLAQGSGWPSRSPPPPYWRPVIDSLGLSAVLIWLAAASGAAFGGHVTDNTF